MYYLSSGAGANQYRVGNTNVYYFDKDEKDKHTTPRQSNSLWDRLGKFRVVLIFLVGFSLLYVAYQNRATVKLDNNGGGEVNIKGSRASAGSYTPSSGKPRASAGGTYASLSRPSSGSSKRHKNSVYEVPPAVKRTEESIRRRSSKLAEILKRRKEKAGKDVDTSVISLSEHKTESPPSTVLASSSLSTLADQLHRAAAAAIASLPSLSFNKDTPADAAPSSTSLSPSSPSPTPATAPAEARVERTQHTQPSSQPAKAARQSAPPAAQKPSQKAKLQGAKRVVAKHHTKAASLPAPVPAAAAPYTPSSPPTAAASPPPPPQRHTAPTAAVAGAAASPSPTSTTASRATAPAPTRAPTQSAQQPSAQQQQHLQPQRASTQAPSQAQAGASPGVSFRERLNKRRHLPYPSTLHTDTHTSTPSPDTAQPSTSSSSSSSSSSSLPTTTPTDVPGSSPIELDLTPLMPLPPPRSPALRERRALVSRMIGNAWGAYAARCFGRDELRPVSGACKEWLGMGISIVDSLSTLWVAGFTAEFDAAVEWVQTHLQQSIARYTKDVSFFEATIRIVGGLLSAHELSGRPALLRMATEVSAQLHAAYDNPYHLPHTHVNLRSGKGSNAQWAQHAFILADIGTTQVEFASLSALTRTPRFAANAHHTTLALAGLRDDDGLAGVYVRGRDEDSSLGPLHRSRAVGFHHSRASTGSDSYSSSSASASASPTTASSSPSSSSSSPTYTSAYSLSAGGPLTIGALGDSYYEYLLKTWISTGKRNPLYRELYVASANGLLKRLWRGTVFGEREERENKENVEKIRKLGGIDASGNSIAWEEQAASTSDGQYTGGEIKPAPPLRTIPADLHGVLHAAQADTRPTPTSGGLSSVYVSPYSSPHSPRTSFAGLSSSSSSSVSPASSTVTLPLRVSNHVLIDDGRPLTGFFATLAPMPSLSMDHLSCFIGGTLALGVLSGAVQGDLAAEHMRYAKQITRTCALSYMRSSTGIGPEEMQFDGSGTFTRISKPSYHLRPETVESLYLLHRATGDPLYREWGWHIASAIEAYCKVRRPQWLEEAAAHGVDRADDGRSGNSPTQTSAQRSPGVADAGPRAGASVSDGLVVSRADDTTVAGEGGPSPRGYGYTSLASVETGTREDRQETFLLAETLKYLYLLFSDDERDVAAYGEDPAAIAAASPAAYLDLSKWVFNTEAHLLRVRPYTLHSDRSLPSSMKDAVERALAAAASDPARYGASAGLLLRDGSEHTKVPPAQVASQEEGVRGHSGWARAARLAGSSSGNGSASRNGDSAVERWRRVNHLNQLSKRAGEAQRASGHGSSSGGARGGSSAVGTHNAENNGRTNGKASNDLSRDIVNAARTSDVNALLQILRDRNNRPK